ncbi:hypothetical protein P5704_006195 [Pseudomonas sp. FeN3W]|nr:hypothetical protein P5704_006195 [Pseudomonas sp. FeN3W]
MGNSFAGVAGCATELPGKQAASPSNELANSGKAERRNEGQERGKGFFFIAMMSTVAVASVATLFRSFSCRIMFPQECTRN